jgi:hypothetical protein
MKTTMSPSSRLQWKWVAITFVLYVVFYLFPLAAASGTLGWFHRGASVGLFFGTWVFGGIIIVAAVAAFLSKGITIWEPALAGGALTEIVLAFDALQILRSTPSERFTMFQVLTPMLLVTTCVFLLSLFGAWLGEWAQRLWRPTPPSEESAGTNAG